MDSPLTAVCIQLLLLYSCFVVVQSQPTVITRPDALLTSSGNIGEGSVIQVYCTAEIDNGVSFTWTFNGSALLNDPPHIRIRTDKDGTGLTSVLTVDNFRDTDNGVYQCTASDGTDSNNGTAVTLIAVPSTSNGTLMIITQPSDNEPVDLNALLNDNRTGIALGATVNGSLLTCTVGHQGDGGLNYSLPSVVWVRNGQVVDDTDSRITITPTTMTNGQLSSSLTITNFGQSDAGVYQCVFTDDGDGGDSEVITTIPYRLDTGNIALIERVSPEVIILRPPEKLVIEVRSSGEYAFHFWRKNENIFTTSGFPVTLPDEFPNFAEIFVREPTTLDDEGVYRVSFREKPGTEQTHSFMPSEGVDFAVIAPVDANTTALTTDTVVILEGGSADISCRSVGAPAPSITWELDNQTTSFEQTDTVTQFEATVTGTVGGQRDVDLTPGNIVSVLHIVNARYPDHDGMYECIGTNADDLNVASSTAIVTVQVHVIPEVEITTIFNTVNLGDTRTLICSVLRGNPTNYTYSIVSLNTMTTTFGQTLVLTDIQLSDLGTYRCDVTNEAGTGSASITIELGVPPDATAVQPDPVVVDTDVDLVCIVTGSLPIEIIWTQTFDNGTSIEVFRGNDTTGGNFTLSVGADDYGSYTCSSTSHIGSDTFSIDIVQAIAPLLHDDLSVEGVTGSPLILTVNITEFNLPLTDITWFIDGVLATEVTGREGNITFTNTSTTSPPATSTFMLDLVQLPIEDGLYSVMVTNDVGSDTTVFNVTVTSRPIVFSPNVDLQVSVSEGNDTSLLCRARGSPAPMFNWYRRSDMLMDRMGRISISSSSIFNTTDLYEVTSELNVTMVDRTDAGMYRCVASNTVLNENSEDDRTFNVTVNFAVTLYEGPVGDTVLAPDAVRLMCRADGVPAPTISWIKTEQNGTVFEYFNSTGNLNITQEADGLNLTSTLTIQPTSALDTAHYSCRASNGFGERISDRTEMVVFVGAQVDSPLAGDVFRVNDTGEVTITCSASGLPAPSVSFLRGNEQLEQTGGFGLFSRFQVGQETSPMLLDDGTYMVSLSFTLVNATDEDTGNMTCQATNFVSELNVTTVDEVLFELIVNIAPTITVSPINVSVVAPNPATFSCAADGVPLPEFTWTRMSNGTESEVMTDNSTIIVNTNVTDRLAMSVLTFSEAQPSLSAMYRCIASNVLGSDNATAELTVSDLPEIIEPVENFTYGVNEGGTVMFDCSASGIPAPSITWFRVNGNVSTELAKDIDSRVSIGILIIDENYQPSDGRGTVFLVNSTLTLDRTMDNDSGTYSCQAMNDFGNATREFELVVGVAPVILTPPTNITAIESVPGPYTFSCLATGRPRPTITWMFMGDMGGTETVMDMTIDNITITYIEIDDREIMSSLTFDVVRPSNDGTYVCVAENDVEDATSSSTLTVNVVPVVTSVYPLADQNNYTVDEGNSVMFECMATGIPAPEITWFRNGVELISSDPRITFDLASSPLDFMRADGETVQMVTRTLNLLNSTDQDSGSYQCVATNVVGSGNDTFEVIIQIAPEITMEPVDVEVVEQEQAVFMCSATGVPRPTITWLKSGTAINVSEPGVNATQSEFGERELASILTLDNVIPSDSAVYVCSAENDVMGGVVMSSATLTVNVVPVVTSVYPEVNQTSYTEDEGDSVMFECTATGIPAPEITWFRNGSELNSTSDPRITFGVASSPMDFMRDDGETVQMVTRTLNLTNTVDEDSGSYQCVATNVAGNGDATFEVIIRIAPEITMGPVDVDVVEQESVSFICTATGRPRPTITWFRASENGSLTSIDISESRINITHSEMGERELTSNLTLSNVIPSDSAVYVCSAENAVEDGVTKRNATLIVNVIPVVTSVYPEVGQMNYTVNESNSVTFECTATGSPAPEITFENTTAIDSRVTIGPISTPIEVVRNSDNETVYQVKQNLTIDNTMDSDSGMYECVAMNEAGEDSELFELIVQVAPEITQNPMDVNITENNDAVYVCLASALPRPVISWEFVDYVSGNVTVIDDEDMDYSVVDKDVDGDERGAMSTLMVLAVVPSDTGVYRCTATNVVGMASQSATLNVYVSPEITDVYPGDNMNYTVNEGDSVTFECTATGIPAPEITWLRNGMAFDPSIDNRTTLSNASVPVDFRRDDDQTIFQVTRSLTLENTMDSDSAANYTCVASNVAMPGVDMMNFDLIVQVAPVIQILEPNELTIISPNEAMYTCQSTARPRPSITWYRVEPKANRTALVNSTKFSVDEEAIGNRELRVNLTVTDSNPMDTTDCV